MKKILLLIAIIIAVPSFSFAGNPESQNLNAIYDVLPDIGSCTAGVLKQSEIDRVLERVNYIRSLHKLKPVTYEYNGQQMSMEGSLNMIAGGTIGHVDDPSSKCYTPGAGQARLKSNLHLGIGTNPTTVISEDIIIGWLIDEHNADKEQNYKVGHRRAIINPFLTRFAFGRADGKPQGSNYYYTGANFLYQDYTNGNISDTDLEYIAYPYEYYPPSYFSKSFYLSFNAIASKSNLWANQNVDYTSAVVTMKTESGSNINVNSVKYDNEGWGSFPNNISWKADGLVNEVRYNVEIKGVVVNGQTKNYSYWFNLTDKNQTSPPQTPQPQLPENLAKNVKVSNALTWSLTDNTNKYILQVSSNANFTSLVIDKNALPTNAYLPNELTHSTQYWWRVAANNDAGTSPWSEVFTFTTAFPLPAKVVLKTPAINADIKTTTPTLTWEAADRADTYAVQIANDNTFEGFAIKFTKSGIEDLSAEVTPNRLVNNTTYYWRVRASNGTGYGEFSEIWSFNIGSSMYGPALIYPENNATKVEKSPLIKWGQIEGADSYRIQITTKENFEESLVVNQGGLTDEEYLFNTSEGGTLYKWRVRGESSGGNGDWSQVNSFTTDPSSSVQSFVDKNFLMYPNPANEQIKLQLNSFAIAPIKILIFDISGNVVHESTNITSEGVNEYIINISHLPISTYMISINSGLNSFVKSFTIVR
ncbi:MAG: CAP domain-containing protein [Candidatus Kapabacteria bacterium]|nr:CAP domain-containing protein [Candidatus Kapabacteria bacterium]